MATKEVRTAIGDIEGGKAPEELLSTDNITIEHLYQTFRWYPGFAEMHELQAKAIWANGITDESIPQDRILEMKRGQVFCYLTGYLAVIVNTLTNPPSIECWNPEIEGTGFIFKKFSDFGYPTEIQIQMKFAESQKPYRYLVPNFPVETMPIQVGYDEQGTPITKEYHLRDRPEKKGYGFFIIRTPEGLPGVRGLPTFLPLMHPIRDQLEILNAFIPYAKKQGMGFPFIGLKDYTPANKNDVKTQWSSQPQSNKLIIGNSEDVIDYVQPTEGSYNPFPMLEWIDMLISRKTQMNKLMLEGDPAGYLSASETAITNWEKDIKQQQVFWRSQWLPIWLVLGADEECAFEDPTEPSFISLMEGLEHAKNAMYGVVEHEDLVEIYNEYLQKHGKEYKLRPISNESMMAMQPNQGDQTNGNSRQF